MIKGEYIKLGGGDGERDLSSRRRGELLSSCGSRDRDLDLDLLRDLLRPGNINDVLKSRHVSNLQTYTVKLKEV